MLILQQASLFRGEFTIRVAVAWTGGKDCCLSCYEAISQGHEVTNLLNFQFTDTEKRTQFKFSNLLHYAFTDVGESTPIKMSILLSFVAQAVNERIPRKISTLLRFILPKLGKRAPRRFTNLFTLMVQDENKMIWHRLRPRIVAQQAEAIGIPIVQRETTWATFEDNIKTTVRQLNPKDVEGMVWGIRPPDQTLLDNSKHLGDYIHVRGEKEWVHKVCSDFEVQPILPLWEKSPEQVLTEVIEKGFEAIVVVVNPEYLGAEWLGHKIDKNFLITMRKLHREQGVPIGGDNYHTLVTDGPLFKKRLKLLQTKTASRNGCLVLDITKAELVEKAN
jgi:uncharacterized protein (TIGR00290 family)